MRLVTQASPVRQAPARPLGASLLAARLILPGEPLDLQDSATLLRALSKTHPPRPPPRALRKHMQAPQRDTLDAVINVRLTAAEKARLKEDADLAGVSVSELVRRRYFGRPIVANADAVMLKEMRRLGGLLKHIHNESGGVYSKETAATLVAIKAYIERLSRGR